MADNIKKSNVPPKPTVARTYLFFLLVPALLAFLLGRNQSSGGALQRLPDSYAVCTRGARIYTVDPKRSTPVECLVIASGRIASLNSLAEVQRIFGDRDKLGSAVKAGLKVFRLPASAAVYPGFIDSSVCSITVAVSRSIYLDLVTRISSSGRKLAKRFSCTAANRCRKRLNASLLQWKAIQTCRNRVSS